jgi:hypothetical protein
MSNHLAKDHVAVDKTKIWVPSTEEHLNSKHTPDQPQAKTDWAYLTTDGSNDAPYLKTPQE